MSKPFPTFVRTFVLKTNVNMQLSTEPSSLIKSSRMVPNMQKECIIDRTIFVTLKSNTLVEIAT